MDVTIEELSPEQQLQLKEAVDQFRQKCLMSKDGNGHDARGYLVPMPAPAT
jgi:hypothetical protein